MKSKAAKSYGRSDEFIESFNNMGYSFTYSDELLCQTEKFICKFYNYNNVSKVNEARLNSFELGNYDEQTMPCNHDLWRSI